MSALVSAARAKFYDNFGLLLVSLTASFLVTGLAGSRLIALLAGLINIFSVVIGFSSTDLVIIKSPALATLVILGILGSATVWFAPVDSLLMSFGASAHVVLLATLTLAIVRRVVSHERVTAQTFSGAIAAYLLIGHVFAWIYLALPGFLGEPALDPSNEGAVPIYYSYVVMTTLGFGDVTPVGALAKRVTVLEALIAQVFLAVLVARLVSIYSAADETGRD